MPIIDPVTPPAAESIGRSTPADVTGASAPRPARRENPVARLRTMQAIALFEAFKGFVALAASVGLLSLLHHDLHHMAAALIGHFGLDPGGHYPSIILKYADLAENANLRSLVLLAVGYVALRLLEAYGLWHELAWGQWLGALSGALYVPFELRHVVVRPNWISFAVLAFNILVVAYLAWQLWRRTRTPATPD